MPHPTRLGVLAAALCLTAATAGCNDEGPQLGAACVTTADCFNGFACVESRCVADDVAAGDATGDDATPDADVAADLGPEPDVTGDTRTDTTDVEPQDTSPDAADVDATDTEADTEIVDADASDTDADADADATDADATDATDADAVFANTCGGDVALDAEPGTRCGTCNTGTWTCDGINAVACEGDRGDLALDSCGRCAATAAAVNDGCEFWTVDLPQYNDPFTEARDTAHAVVLANPNDIPVTVSVTTRSETPPSASELLLPAGAVEVFSLPVTNTEGTSTSFDSYRLLTSAPVVAYQFNPLNSADVSSNDASLLLPPAALGVEYYVVSRPSVSIPIGGFDDQNGWFTVVATQEGTTQVTITFSTAVNDGDAEALQGISAGESRVFALEQFEVLNVEATGAAAPAGDLTGTHLVADQSITVFSGHSQATVGSGFGGAAACCADHLEEQLFPVNTWGTEYLAVHSPPRGGSEPDVWRVVASRDGTTLSTDPVVEGLHGVTLDAGEFVEAESVASFALSASQPVSVAQFLVGQEDARIGVLEGDPSMALTVPTLQFLDRYTVQVPSSYTRDWLVVVRPSGVEVHLDGVPITTRFTAIGTTGYESSVVPVTPGAHAVSSPSGTRFGLYGYGYSSTVSYAYPAGLGLRSLEP